MASACPGDGFAASHCNQKLIGAQFFAGRTLASSTPIPPYEYMSPRDFSGHGTATPPAPRAATPAWPPTGMSAVFGNISGIAPRARIAAYKSCFYDRRKPTAPASAPTAWPRSTRRGRRRGRHQLLVGGSLTSFRDAGRDAFLFAADAGVFVATSAGNPARPPARSRTRARG
jgi:hypothetical protein